MEKWQKDYITENLPSLVDGVRCHANLLSNLCKYGVLANADVSILTAVGKSDGEDSKSHQLLHILCTRQKGYEHLAKSLYNCRQTGALLTLLYGVQINIPHKNPFQFCGIELNTNDFFNKSVDFEGTNLPLSQICKCVDTVKLQRLLQGNIDAVFYNKFHSDESIILALETVPKSIPFYIPRRLSMKTVVEASVFEALRSDVFLIEGVEMHQLTLLTKAKRGNNPSNILTVDKSSHQIHELTARIILLEHHHHFNEISNNSSRNVHWLKFKDGTYHYVRSNSGEATNRIKKHITDNTTNDAVISQEEFVQKLANDSQNNCPVILYDSPGMGKSILLAELARSIKCQQPFRNVIFLQFAELINHLTASGGRLNATAFKSSLLDFTTTSMLGRKLMEQLLDNPNHHVQIFLDGFDELHENDIQAAVKMLKCVYEDCRNMRLFVTSRPHRADQLESVFGVMGYNILPFSDADQISFFTKYWESQHDVVTTNEVREFAKRCLTSYTAQISNEERDIAGIPLQCRMLAEIYAECAKVQDATSIESENRVNSIYKMYKEYMELKFAAACNDKEERAFLYQCHVKLAVQLLFSENAEKEKHENELTKLYAIGVVEPSQSDLNAPNFVHRTFAEFIAAEYLITMSTRVDDHEVGESFSFLDLFIRSALATHERHVLLTACNDIGLLSRVYLEKLKCQWYNHTVVVKFLNSSLAVQTAKIKPSEGLRCTLRKSNYFTPIILVHLIMASLTSKVRHLLIFILHLYLELDYNKINCKLSIRRFLPENKEVDAQNSYSSFVSQLREFSQLKQLMNIAVWYSSFHLTKFSYELLCSLSWKNLNELDLQDSLKLTVHRGNYQIFDYLLGLYKPSITVQSSLLYECLYFSAENQSKVVAEKVQIVKLILSESPELLNSYKHNSFAPSPLRTLVVHFELVKCFIDAGADLGQTIESNKENICHKAAETFSDAEFHELVELLIAKELGHFLTLKNHDGEASTHIALRHIELKVETLELLSGRFKINFNDTTAKKGSELAYAIRGGRSRQVLEGIVRCGGNWKSVGFNKNVISLAIKHNNMDALKYFISLGANPNKRHNAYLKTPLSTALVYSNDVFEAVKILIENGADVNALFIFEVDEEDDCNDDQYHEGVCSNMSKHRCMSPLQYAREYGGTESVRILEDSGAEICRVKSCCTTSCLFLFCFPCLAHFLTRRT